MSPHAFSDYDLWKAHNPIYDDYEEPPFECMECCDTGYAYPGELCEYCQQLVTLEDLEEIAADLDQDRALQLTRR